MKSTKNTDMIEKTRRECMDCKVCTKHCSFLQKYNMNLKEYTYKKNYSECFMCDTCKHHCPKNLSGAEITQELKSEKSNLLLKLTKDPYIFKRVSSKKSTYTLFLGCNYPKYYPKTCEKLIEICNSMGIDFSIDCCRKPLFESGDASLEKLEKDILQKKTQTLICVCPNCYHTLKNKLNIKVISVYEFLYENNIGEKISGANIYLPCSDKYSKEIFQYIKPYLENYTLPFTSINCCGLGGGVLSRHPETGVGVKDAIKSIDAENIYTYCSSCSFAFNKYKISNIHNILSVIIGVDEKVSDTPVKNALYFKFRGEK